MQSKPSTRDGKTWPSQPVVFSGDEPTQLVLGVHGCTNMTKNEFFHIVDLTAPVLPSAIDLVPMLHEGLKTLLKMNMQNDSESELLFHNGDGKL